MGFLIRSLDSIAASNAAAFRVRTNSATGESCMVFSLISPKGVQHVGRAGPLPGFCAMPTKALPGMTSVALSTVLSRLDCG